MKLRDDPTHCPSGFSFDLYCKYETGDYAHDSQIGEIHGPTERDARKLLRQSGWVLHRDRTATCPSCARMLGLR